MTRVNTEGRVKRRRTNERYVGRRWGEKNIVGIKSEILIKKIWIG